MRGGVGAVGFGRRRGRRQDGRRLRPVCRRSASRCPRKPRDQPRPAAARFGGGSVRGLGTGGAGGTAGGRLRGSVSTHDGGIDGGRAPPPARRSIRRRKPEPRHAGRPMPTARDKATIPVLCRRARRRLSRAAAAFRSFPMPSDPAMATTGIPTAPAEACPSILSRRPRIA